MGKYTDGEDIFGNKVTYGPNGEKYIHTKDMWGKDVTLGPDGRKTIHTQDIFGNNISITPDEKKYFHNTDIFGNKITQGPNGEKYVHGEDLLGNKVTWGPDNKRFAPDNRSDSERDTPNPWLNPLDAVPDDFPSYSEISAPEENWNINLMYESAMDKHYTDYYDISGARQRGEKIILNISNYRQDDEYDLDERKKYDNEMDKYAADDFSLKEQCISCVQRLVNANNPTAGYIKGKGWPLARRHCLRTYYPDNDICGNEDDMKEIIYFLKEDGHFAVYIYEDEYIRLYRGGAFRECKGEDLALLDCPIEVVAKALDFDFYIYETAYPKRNGKELEWIYSSTILGDFGSGWKGANQLAVRKYRQKGEGLLRALQSLMGCSGSNSKEPAQAYASFCQIVKTLQAREQARRAEEQRLNILAEENRKRANFIKKRNTETKRAYWISIAFNILFYTIVFLSAERGTDWRVFFGCALTGLLTCSYLGGLKAEYIAVMPLVLTSILLTPLIAGLEIAFLYPSGGKVYLDPAGYVILGKTPLMLAGQIITFFIGTIVGRRASSPKGSVSQHPGMMADIYITYIMIALSAAVCIFVFAPKIPDGIQFWRQLL